MQNEYKHANALMNAPEDDQPFGPRGKQSLSELAFGRPVAAWKIDLGDQGAFRTGAGHLD